MGYRDYLCRKFGSEARFHELSEHVKAVAKREGLDFRLDEQEIYPNTRNAHRVILMAREQGKQEKVAEAMFNAFFTKGLDLSRIENLVAIAESQGLDSERVEMLLDSNTGKTEIEMAEKELHELGITSVPLFIIDDKTAIPGAQAVEVFVKTFEESVAASAALQEPAWAGPEI